MAKVDDNIMRDAEDKGLREWRRLLLQNISGDVLELAVVQVLILNFILILSSI
jgi:hypothetical protein